MQRALGWQRTANIRRAPESHGGLRDRCRTRRIVGEGWHQRAGEAHAEINAIAGSGEQAAGATAYVTLEPCAHHGKTPPCCDALIAAGVARRRRRDEDPNPKVDGQRHRKTAGCRGRWSAVGLLADDADSLIAGFLQPHCNAAGRVCG